MTDFCYDVRVRGVARTKKKTEYASGLIRVEASGVAEAKKKALALAPVESASWWPKATYEEFKADRVTLDTVKTVLRHYLKGTPAAELEPVFKRNKVTREGTYFGMSIARDGPVAANGQWRFWYDFEGTLFSYEMPIARRLPDGLVLLNGDGAPTKQTNQVMWALRRAVEDVDAPVPHAFIPFSTLTTAGLDFKTIKVLATTPDRVITRLVKGEKRETHFLGETLFTDGRRFFVCGLDRNDDPRRRMFYLCQVPGKTALKTVDDALDRLRPKDVPSDTPRQGEWYFLKRPDYKPVLREVQGRPYQTLGKRIPILSDEEETQGRAFSLGGEPNTTIIGDRAKRHVAHRMVVDKNGRVYVHGAIRDDEHDTLQLGPVWHEVRKNLAIVGFRYAPTPVHTVRNNNNRFRGGTRVD